MKWRAALAACLLAGCGSDKAATTKEADAGLSDASARPNFSEDIYPLVAKNCLPCHRAGGKASLPLITAELAAQSSGHMRHAVLERQMPPWGVDDSGSCGDWVGARWLAPEEIATFISWLDNGTPAGPPVNAFLPGPRWEQPHADAAIWNIGGDYVPGLGDAAEHCFVVDPALTANTFVTGLSLGDDRPVREITLYALDTPEAEQAAMALDAQSPIAGYQCTGGSGIAGARLVAGVTWNTPVMRFPAGTGAPLTAGKKLVAQLQYDLFYRTADKQARLSVELSPSVRGGTWTELRATPLALASGLSDAVATVQMTAPRPFTPLAVFPQMRRLGKSLDVTLEGSGRRTCLVRQLFWAYDMLREPRVYATPPSIAAGDLLTLTCHFSTQGRPAVHDGDAYDDEECAVAFFTTD